MLFKVLLCLCFLHVVVAEHLRNRRALSINQSPLRGTWKKIATNQCVGSKGNHYRQFQYNSRSTFVVAMKLVHKSGRIGCAGGHFSYWGCHHGIPTNIIVTDMRNQRMYPSPKLIHTQTGGWYDLPGYGLHSRQLVFDDVGYRWFQRGLWLRIWYGEDLHNFTEHDNHGFTCMDVFIYTVDL